MKKSIACAALMLSLAGGAAAEGIEFHPLVGAGFTFGGDTVASVSYTNGSTADVHAGGLIALLTGMEVRWTDIVSTQATIGYHVDQASASNGDVTFARLPFELMGHYRVLPWMRLGVGGRYISGARIRSSGAASSSVPNEDFKASLGGIVEAEFFPITRLGIKLRYVHETFQSQTPGASDLDGSHVGILFVGYY